MPDYQQNECIAAEILRQRHWNGQSFKLGDHVVLLDGQVIAVKSTATDALRALRQREPDFERGMVVRIAPRLQPTSSAGVAHAERILREQQQRRLCDGRLSPPPDAA